MEPRGMAMLNAALTYVVRVTNNDDRDKILQIVRESIPESEESVMTTIAEAWIEEGVEEGLVRGLRLGIATALEIRFPQQAESLIARITEIHSTQTLTELLQMCKTAAAAGDLLRFVDQIMQR